MGWDMKEEGTLVCKPKELVELGVKDRLKYLI